MEERKFLNKIHSPKDVKKLKEAELPALAKEIREVLIETVSQNGGHLASNLGVVELSIALHRCFDSPNDQIVWDVGHQVYVHKLLTGRYDRFATIRKQDGLSGFSRPTESEHDIFFSGHASTSISSALGLAMAKAINNNKNYVVAVIGDGAFTGGLAFEGLNNAGRTKSRLIVILNDNNMSISENVGAMARYFAVIRSKPSYFRFKARIEKAVKHIPFIGNNLAGTMFRSKTKIKNLIYRSTMFENIGFRYMGPIDGHNVAQLTTALEGAKYINKPVLLHINTTKGKGYDFAERSPSTFHGISKFDVVSGEQVYSGQNFSNVFGEFLCDLASKNRKICAITAAMSLGTGLHEFSQKFPARFFDVGIAEEHAVTFASGLARNGMLPVFAVYSTFLQRCYDQLIHDAALQNQKIIFAVDRAGFVGEDGETHQGVFDVAFLNTIPRLTIYSPATYGELKNAFIKAFYHDEGIVAVRYPRGEEISLPEDFTPSFDTFDVYGDKTADTVIVTYGRLFENACKAFNNLKEKGINAKIVKLNQIKPIDEKAVAEILNSRFAFFFEEGIRSGGTGERLALELVQAGYQGKYQLTAVNDCFVPHAGVNALIKQHQLDADSMTEIISGSVSLG